MYISLHGPKQPTVLGCGILNVFLTLGFYVLFLNKEKVQKQIIPIIAQNKPKYSL